MADPSEVHGSEAEAQPQPSEVDNLRKQFTEQFQTQKEAFEVQISKLTEENEVLHKHVEELQRSLVRATVTSPAPVRQDPEMSAEEQYQASVNALAARAIKMR